MEFKQMILKNYMIDIKQQRKIRNKLIKISIDKYNKYKKEYYDKFREKKVYPIESMVMYYIYDQKVGVYKKMTPKWKAPCFIVDYDKKRNHYILLIINEERLIQSNVEKIYPYFIRDENELIQLKDKCYEILQRKNIEVGKYFNHTPEPNANNNNEINSNQNNQQNNNMNQFNINQNQLNQFVDQQNIIPRNELSISPTISYHESEENEIEQNENDMNENELNLNQIQSFDINNNMNELQNQSNDLEMNELGTNSNILLTEPIQSQTQIIPNQSIDQQQQNQMNPNDMNQQNNNQELLNETNDELIQSQLNQIPIEPIPNEINQPQQNNNDNNNINDNVDNNENENQFQPNLPDINRFDKFGNDLSQNNNDLPQNNLLQNSSLIDNPPRDPVPILREEIIENKSNLTAPELIHNDLIENIPNANQSNDLSQSQNIELNELNDNNDELIMNDDFEQQFEAIQHPRITGIKRGFFEMNQNQNQNQNNNLNEPPSNRRRLKYINWKKWKSKSKASNNYSSNHKRMYQRYQNFIVGKSIDQRNRKFNKQK